MARSTVDGTLIVRATGKAVDPACTVRVRAARSTAVIRPDTGTVGVGLGGAVSMTRRVKARPLASKLTRMVTAAPNWPSVVVALVRLPLGSQTAPRSGITNVPPRTETTTPRRSNRRTTVPRRLIVVALPVSLVSCDW